MDDHDLKAIRRFESSVRARDLEIDLFWRRGAFFWLFIAAAFAGFGLAATNGHYRLALLISGFGFIASWAWWLANRGSRFWFTHWEKMVEATQSIAVGELFRSTDLLGDDGWFLKFEGKRFSVSRLAIAISMYTTALWIAAIIYVILSVEWRFSSDDWRAQIKDFAVVSFLVATLLFAAGLYYSTKEHKESSSGGDEPT